MTSTASAMDVRSLSTVAGKWSFCCVVGGALCGLPWDSSNVLILKPEAEVPSPVEERTLEDLQSDDSGLEKGFNGVPEISEDIGDVLLQDFVGAWLSEWIYFADPLKPVAVPTMKPHG